MQYDFNLYILPLLIAGASSLWVAYYAWSHRDVLGASALALLALSAGSWTASYGLELAGTGLAAKVFWSKVEYIGVTTVPLLWLVFCYNYFNQNRQLPRRVIGLLGIVPLITFLLILNVESHDLIWTDYYVREVGVFSILEVTHGFWFWVYWGYGNLIMIISTYFVIRLVRHRHGLYRGQITALIVAAAAPWVGNFLYVSGVTKPLDLTPFAFAIAVIAVAWGIFRFQLINLVPLARDAMVEAMDTGMMVIDSQGRVADVNRAAANMIGQPVDAVLNKPAAEVLSRWPHLTQKYASVLEALDEIPFGEGDDQRWIELGLSPLRNKDQTVMARIVTLRDVTVRRQAGERLRELYQAVEASPVSIVITDVEGRIQYVNPKYSAVSGYSLPEVKNSRIVNADETLPESQRQLWDTITSGREWHGEICNRKKSGELYWENASISPILDTGGQIANYVVVKEDITERRQMQEQLQVKNKYLSILHDITLDLLNRRELNDLLQAIVNHAADLLHAPLGEIMLKEGETLVVYSFTSNQEFLSVDRVGRETAKLAWQAHDTGKPAILEDYSTWDERRPIYDRVRPRAVADFPVMVEGRCVAVIGMGRTEPGQIFMPEEIETGILFSRLVGLVLDSANLYASAMREVNERKMTEFLLQESEARYRQIVESADELISRTDAEGNVTYVNPTSLRLFGFEKIEEIIGRNYTEFIAPAWRARARRFYIRQFLRQEPNSYFEFPVITGDGHECWLGQNVQVVRDGNLIVGFQAVARDITTIKHAQEALSLARDQAQEASHFKGDLLARVSHELRTPLSGILGYSELLRDQALGPLSKDQKQAVDTIFESTEFLAALINDLMDQAQIEAKKLVLHFGECSPAKILRELEEMMTVLAQKKGLTLRTILEPEVPPLLYSDAQRLRQILINLVANALKFTKQGEVRVRMFQPDPAHWAMEISDTGIGVPKESQALIFEPFQKAKSSLTRDNRGIGLGLSITKQLVELLDGQITLTSEVGKGSTFRVTLPINKTTMSKPFVLIIEDDPKLAVIFQMTLQQIGFDTALDIHGNQYGSILSAVCPALVILDLHMPFISGVEILQQIRADQRLSQVPVIVTTADLILAKTIEGQAEEILIKPVSVTRLRETVLRMVPESIPNESETK